MLTLIQAPLKEVTPGRPEIGLSVERLMLAKRRWRGRAENGREFGFDLDRPLRHGTVFFQDEDACYVIRQVPESVLEVSLEVAPSAAAGIGWAIGNLHLDLSAEPARLLALDEPAVRRLLERLDVPYRPTQAIFRPGHFSRSGRPSHELGPSHRHP